jgi:di-N-acetylchitobiase
MMFPERPTRLLLLLTALATSSADGYVTPEASAALLRPGGAEGYPGDCPCANASLCDPITTPRFADGGELFVFHVPGEAVNFDQWRNFDFSRITVIALWDFPEMGAELLCHAHSLGIRILLPDTPPSSVYNSTNETAKAAWAAETVATVKGLFADGINIDTEDAISPGDVQARDGLTAITKRARTALDEAGMKSAVVSFDVGWMPGVDGRFYDHQGLAEVCDYLVVMGYGT